MNEFLIKLQAKLDEAKSKGNINSDIDKIQTQINRLKIQAEIDPKTISNLVKQLETVLNQKINISNININTAQTEKTAQQTGQQIGNNIAQGISKANGQINNALKSFSDLRNFSELNKSISNFHIDTSEFKNYQTILDKVKNTYAEFGQVKITNETFNNGILEKFKVNIEQVNGDLKETKSFIMSLNENKDAFVFNGLISGSESIVQHLDNTKNAVNQTAEAINALKDKTKADKIQLSYETGGYESKVDSLIAKTNQWVDANGNARISTNSLQTALNNLDKAYLSLTADGGNTQANQQALIQAEQVLNKEIKTVTNSIASMNAEFMKTSAIDNLRQKYQQFLDLNGKIKSTSMGPQITSAIKELGSGMEVSVTRGKQLESQLINIQNVARQTGKLGKTWFQTIRDGMSSFSYWTSSTFLVMKAIQSIKGGLSSVYALDTALVDLKKTTTMTTSELEDFYYASNDVAKQMGVTTEEIINQASAWSRLGYSSAEAATKMAKYSSMFASISPGMDIDAATDGLVSIMKAYDIGNENPDDVLDGIMSKINIIGNTAATSNAELVNMLQKSSSAMAEANNTLEQTIALETAAVEITRDDDSVGTAFKTVAMRINFVPLYGDI